MSSTDEAVNSRDEPLRLAIVDIGTNTIKFSVFEIDRDGSTRLLASDSKTVRLGADIDRTGRISSERTQRAIVALQRFEHDGRKLGVSVLTGVTTEAFRSASNGAEVLATIGRSTGWRLRVIDGLEESRLTFRGLQAQLAGYRACVVADVGGGSTELLHVSAGSLVRAESVPIGSGRFADAYFTTSGPTEETILRAREAARMAIQGALPNPPECASLVLSGGNGIFLATLSRHFAPNVVFSNESLASVAHELVFRPAAEIAGVLSIAVERAEVLPAGCAISQGAIDALTPRHLVAAPSGIREGILRDWLETHGWAETTEGHRTFAGQIE